MFRQTHSQSYRLAICLLAGLWGAAAQAQSGQSELYTGYHIAIGKAVIQSPFFKIPSGHSEVAVPLSQPTLTATIGYDYFRPRTGGSVVFGLSRMQMEDFRLPNAVTGFGLDEGFSLYADPEYQLLYLDAVAHWLPLPRLPASIYGFLGLGARWEQYTISGSIFPEWDGLKSTAEFTYSYGLGFRFVAGGGLSLWTDYRLIPGDSTANLELIETSAGYNYFRVVDTIPQNFATLFSIRISLSI